MYEYKYVYLNTGGGAIFGNSDAAHRDAIKEKAQEGWRYVGFVPREFTSHGGIKAMDLIFERPVSE